MLCAMRADKAHRRLHWGDTALKKDSSGLEFVEVNEPLTKKAEVKRRTMFLSKEFMATLTIMSSAL